jgi:beta-N-acetylhexosaminidase
MERSMEIEDRIGQLFFIGLEGTVLTPASRELLAEIRPGGVVHFARNVVDASQVLALNESILDASRLPPFLAVDEEGGRVSRLRPILGPMPAAALLGSGTEERVREFGRALGAALAALGFNADFAPVVDLSSPGAPSGIGDRSFGEDPEGVARCARAFVAGLASEGIAAFLKHFPGLGATEVDSHAVMPVCPRSNEELWAIDLVPYRACGQEAAGVMVAHAHYPAYDAGEATPASLSSAIVIELLRMRLGLDGIALTDDLEMGAVQGPDPGELALRARNDMVMFCNDPGKALAAHRAVLAAARAGVLDRSAIERSVERIVKAKARLGITGEPRSRARPPIAAALERLAPFRLG